MDDARLGNGMSLEDVARELSAIRSDMSAMRSDMSVMRSDMSAMSSGMSEMRSDLTGRITVLDTKVDSHDSRMRIGFEETHRVAKLGFESVQILDEKIDRRFDETERQHAEHKTLIEAAVTSLSREAQRPAGPALRRRR